MNDRPPLTPHGPSFRFVDRFELSTLENQGTGTFYLAPELSFFADHFPGNPIMPAVLLIESAAQTAGILWMHLSQPDQPESPLANTPLFVAAVDGLRIQGPAHPGETLSTHVELLKEFGTLAQFQFQTISGQAPVAKGRLTLSRTLGNGIS